MTGFTLRDYRSQDTIAAIATFPGNAALGVIKISGSAALKITAKLFLPAKKKDIEKVKTFTIHYGWIVEKSKLKSKKVKLKRDSKTTFDKGTIIDEVLVSVMRKPRTYTTEDVVEISSHGPALVLNKILKMVIDSGARLALPGEFTYRALAGGRIDLLQAESISGIVQAKSDEALLAASRQLQGARASGFDAVKAKLKSLVVETENMLNFSEDDTATSNKSLIKKVKQTLEMIGEIARGSEEAKILKEGVHCVICGRTNVGKSTLFNRLLKEERVIVSRFHGTTRDVVEEVISIKGVPLRIFDTAGILEARDIVTRQAVERSRSAFERADFIILVLDASRSLNRDDRLLIEKTKNKNAILVLNKDDLPRKFKEKEITGFKGKVVSMSALKNTGLADFEKAVYESVHSLSLNRENIIFLSNFQRAVLTEIHKDISEAVRLLLEGYTVDFVGGLFMACWEKIGKITGEVYSEEILESIFSEFCIGK